MSDTAIRITEIFYSLQGEARSAGRPTVFVRLTGCPLRCGYCDSEYAFHGGERMSVSAILEKIKSYGCNTVCVTGGEPLAQPGCHDLLKLLADEGCEVSLETSGALDIADVDSRICVVMDLKTPASGELERNLYSNVEKLKPSDQVKFVICNREDYEWARFKIDELQLVDRVEDVLLSPSHDQVAPAELARWILDDRLNVRFQMQLHKQLWGDKPGV
ncbi:MAG: 7-carboxy-7-deazaguanine synthase QueE [Agarilytica sp.]